MSEEIKDLFIKEAVKLFTNHESIKIKTILLVGSKLDPSNVDFWSDTDIIIILNPTEVIDKEQIENIILKIGRRIGKEEYSSANVMTQRLVIEKKNRIERLDLKICTYDAWAIQAHSIDNQHKILFGDPLNVELEHKKLIREVIKIEYNSDEIDQIWFLFFECVKKFMRNDHLIGLHLLLDLLRSYLVMKMLERDIIYNTNIHKIGYREKLPEEIEINRIDYMNKEKVLNYIEKLAIEFDKEFLKQHKEYQSRVGAFLKYMKESKKNIKE
ncbi:MAG: hypothetical protein SFU99_03595 [Saprospiraceae bacterium]|nr:hypothetical protein [Saprospiraceae bacterium]